MFWWKKRKPQPNDNTDADETIRRARGNPSASNSFDEGATLQPLSVHDVMDQFLVQNPSQTPYSVHALIKAGAIELMSSAEVLDVCEKIQHHGHPYPLNPTLMAELDESELLPFLRWQASSNVPVTAYQNENTIRQLINDFRLQKHYL